MRCFSSGKVGVIVESFDGPAYERAAEAIFALAADPGCRERCREVARETFSLEDVGISRYDALYRRLAALSATDGGTRR